jgi:hypothetical protein
LAPYSHAEKDFLNAMTLHLNRTIEQSIVTGGSFFEDVVDLYSGHEICGDRGEWINPPYFSPFEDTLVEDASFHPNLFGQAAYGQELNGFLTEFLAPAASRSRSASPNQEPLTLQKPDGSVGPLAIEVDERICETSLVPGQSLEVHGTDYRPLARVLFTLKSSNGLALLEKRATSDQSGDVEVKLTLPGDLPSGVYGLEASGPEPSLAERSLVRAFEVARCS